MIHCDRKLESQEAKRDSDLVVELPYEERRKCRIRTRTQCGRDVGIVLSRGEQLFDGDTLIGDGVHRVRVVAAPEAVAVVCTDDPLALARAAYHLGNRHVPLQLGPGWVRFQRDHVLEAMIQGLGLPLSRERLPFQPEHGAYHNHGERSPHMHAGGVVHAH